MEPKGRFRLPGYVTWRSGARAVAMAAPVSLLAAFGYVYLSDRYSVDPSGPTPQPTVSPLHAEDTLVEIREGEDELRTRELRRFSFKTIPR